LFGHSTATKPEGLAANHRARARSRVRARVRLRSRRTFTAEKKKQSVLLDSGVRRNDESLTKNEPNEPNDLNDPNILSDKGPAPQAL